MTNIVATGVKVALLCTDDPPSIYPPSPYSRLSICHANAIFFYHLKFCKALSKQRKKPPEATFMKRLMNCFIDDRGCAAACQPVGRRERFYRRRHVRDNRRRAVRSVIEAPRVALTTFTAMFGQQVALGGGGQQWRFPKARLVGSRPRPPNTEQMDKQLDSQSPDSMLGDRRRSQVHSYDRMCHSNPGWVIITNQLQVGWEEKVPTTGFEKL